VHRLLRIADVKNGVFLGMSEVLAPLAPEANELRWNILDVGDVIADEDADLDVLDNERRVLDSPTGRELSFAELSSFAASTMQVIDGLFVACVYDRRLPRRSDDDLAILSDADLVVAAFDSTFWLVSAADPVLKRVEHSFRVVTEEDPASTPLRIAEMSATPTGKWLARRRLPADGTPQRDYCPVRSARARDARVPLRACARDADKGRS
jgi:hypothetical protein